MKVGVTRVHRNQKGTLAETSLRSVRTPPPTNTHSERNRENTPHTDLSVVGPPTLDTACSTSPNLPGRWPPVLSPGLCAFCPLSIPRDLKASARPFPGKPGKGAPVLPSRVILSTPTGAQLGFQRSLLGSHCRVPARATAPALGEIQGSPLESFPPLSSRGFY